MAVFEKDKPGLPQLAMQNGEHSRSNTAGPAAVEEDVADEDGDAAILSVKLPSRNGTC